MAPALGPSYWVSADFARQLERELAEAREANRMMHASCTEAIDQMKAISVREVAKRRSERDQWREVAEELMNSAMDITDGIEWPPFDNAREKFRKLKEASK